MRIGLVGAGRQGRRRLSALMEYGDEPVVIADAKPDSAADLARICNCKVTKNWLDVVRHHRVDSVVVCTPNDLHAPVTIAAASKGKHVLCEKPLARTPHEAREIVEAAKKYNVRVKCGFTLRHHQGIKQAKAWLDEGRLGKLLYMRCLYGICGRPGYDKEWRGNKEIAGGGELMDQGVHVLDLFRWFGGDFEQVVGYSETMYWDVSPLEDNAFVMLKSRNGPIGIFHVSWTEWKNRFSLEIFGDKAYARVEGLGGSYGVERLTMGRREFEGPFQEEAIEYRGDDGALVEEWKEFSSAISENREPMGNAYDGWAAVRLAYAVYESNRNRHVVDVVW